MLVPLWANLLLGMVHNGLIVDTEESVSDRGEVVRQKQIAFSQILRSKVWQLVGLYFHGTPESGLVIFHNGLRARPSEV